MVQRNAQQNYLKAIYRLTRDGGRATTSRLAAILDVQAAAVTNMLQKLAGAEPPLVDYRKHHGARLTAVGRQKALAAIRQHRLIETFLYEKLDFDWAEIHAEAELLESAISTRVSERMAAALDHPQTTPHGHPIPAVDLVVTGRETRPLTMLAAGETAVIARIGDENPALLRFLAAHALRPGSCVTLHRKAVDGTLTLLLVDKAEKIVIRPWMTAHIFIAAATKKAKNLEDN